ncbi:MULTISPECIES: hypothetical protein [Kordiimonas]|jgi:hypothetical protein|nr:MULTISPECIES: hypothetical protein [Kordiimonas]
MRLSVIFSIMMVLLSGFGAQDVRAQDGEGEEIQDVGKPRIEMKPFNMALLERGRVRGQVTMHLVLVIEQKGGHEFVRTRLPQLRADFNSALTVLARQRFSVSRPIDPDIVKAYLTPYADQRLGSGVVSVYVKQALIEPS